MTRARVRLVALVPVVAAIGSALSPTALIAEPAPRTTGSGTAAFEVHGSVEEVYVTGARPRATAELVDGSGHTVASKRFDNAGSMLFEHVRPGRGYVVRQAAAGKRTESQPLRVLAPDANPPESLYRAQRLQPGYNYITTRDGTKLAAMVRLPGPPDAGPYPTVIEYSGYDPANPDSPEPSTLIAGVLGYATVGVNVRGTGCSGGALDLFETLQSLDGYDAVETVAAQPWVAHGKVGMVGISYPGIMQLFVAATRPPHLAAISPLSVLDDVYRATLYPGGILNSGFATTWAKQRQEDAKPAGQGWARKRINQGDSVCKANQTLRGQNHDLVGDIKANRFYTPKRGDPLAPYAFVNRIAVPVFLAGAWQDEQTGGHFPDMLDRFSPKNKVRFTLTNGTHADSLGPAIITRLAEFLDFYVAQRAPSVPEGVRNLAPTLYSILMGVSGVTVPPDRFAGLDYAAALRQYEAEPPVRILFDNGAGAAPGAPQPAFEMSLPSWPPPKTRARVWYFGSRGHLSTAKPTDRHVSDRYRYDPSARPATDLSGDAVEDVWKALPPYEWKPLPDGTAVAYVTEPLQRDMVMVGSGSVDLWLRSGAPDVDLQATLSEVRPDGKETYVQNGWLRASHRKLDERASTALRPRHTHHEADAKPLPKDRFALVRVELFPFGHAFRKGSRIRVTIEAPGGDRPRWKFDALSYDHPVTNEVARTAEQPSRVALPVLDGATVPTPLPPCPALRGQPCRGYVAPPG